MCPSQKTLLAWSKGEENASVEKTACSGLVLYDPLFTELFSKMLSTLGGYCSQVVLC